MGIMDGYYAMGLWLMALALALALALAGEHEFERSEFARREERVGARSVDALGNDLLRRLV